MKFIKKLAAYFSAAMLIFTAAITAFAAEGGSIDWGNGIIRVTGNGVGKAAYKDSNPGQYRLTARQAARMDAQRKLAEYAEGVMVTGNSSMRDFALEDDKVETMLKSVVVKNALEVGDYSYSDDGVCEVTMELRLFGGRGSLSEAAFLPYKNKQKISFPAPVDKNALKQLAAASKTYTGLVVDCSGLNINCVMSPVILNEQGTTIYGYQNLDYDKIIVRGMVSYAEEIGDQISQARAGENPLVIKALSLDEFQANPKVSVADADKILAANQHDKFLDNCAVVFVK